MRTVDFGHVDHAAERRPHGAGQIRDPQTRVAVGVERLILGSRAKRTGAAEGQLARRRVRTQPGPISL